MNAKLQTAGGGRAGHTEGPWVVDECDDALGYQTIRRADGTPNGDIHAEPIATVYTVADADLIASAPSLLAERDSLRAVVDEAEDFARFSIFLNTGLPENDENMRRTIHDIRERAKAFLAKAREALGSSVAK